MCGNFTMYVLRRTWRMRNVLRSLLNAYRRAYLNKQTCKLAMWPTGHVAAMALLATSTWGAPPLSQTQSHCDGSGMCALMHQRCCKLARVSQVMMQASVGKHVWVQAQEWVEACGL